MKAVMLERFGPPEEVLTLGNVMAPVAGDGQVRIRMLVSPINPSDLMMVAGRYGVRPKLPAIPGFEGVGVIESVGSGLLARIRGLRPGRRVAVLNDQSGNWAEYVVISARQAIPLPDDVPDEQAASFFVNPATALVMTRYVLAVPKGEWLLQSAAGSALGQMIIRLAEVEGFQTINVVRRPEQIDELKRLGANAVICFGERPLRDAVAELTGGRGVRFAIDPVGGAIGSEVIASLGRGGRCLLYGLLSGEPVTVDPRSLITGSKRIEGFWLSDWAKAAGIPTMLGLFRQITKGLQSGVLQSPVGQIYPLDRITDAVRHAQADVRRGKVLLRIGTR